VIFHCYVRLPEGNGYRYQSQSQKNIHQENLRKIPRVSLLGGFSSTHPESVKGGVNPARMMLFHGVSNGAQHQNSEKSAEKGQTFRRMVLLDVPLFSNPVSQV
jgi:hypothetical protein